MALTEKHPTSPELPPYNILVVYEMFSLKKVCTVGADAMAFRSRGPQPNILTLINWAEDERNTTGVDDARAISDQLIKIVQSTAEKQPTESENEGYLNYRMCEIGGIATPYEPRVYQIPISLR